ncbi:MAG TPA: CapA family protein [Ktedonobacterales bacterium]|nr:CapA family protein [Ktedonobacterales bacterium]
MDSTDTPDSPGTSSTNDGDTHSDRTPRLTRRELLAAAAAASAAVAVAGCAPGAVTTARKPSAPASPFALSRPATLYADATVPRALADRAVALLQNVAGLSNVTAAKTLTAQTDVVLTFGSPPGGYSAAAVGVSPATVLTHLRVPVDGVSAAQARALLSGATRNWREMGAPYSLAVRPLALAGLSNASAAPASNAQTYTSAAGLLDALRKTAGGVALAPLELADWTARNLGVDGVYPAQGRGNLAQNPLGAYTLTLAAHATLVKQGLNVHALAAALAPLLATSTSVIDMAAVGDIMLGRTVNSKMVAYRDYLYPYRKMHDELHAADLRVANLECTITDTVPIPSDPSTFYFVTAKKAVSGIVYAGFDAVTVANNHADGPGGVPAMLDMLATLRANGIAHCGGGSDLDAARQPAIVAKRGVRFAFLGYNMVPPLPQGPFATPTSGGIAPVNLDTLPHDIAAARKRADLVIPYFHWGIEYTKDPTSDQQRAARAAIDAGADMVLGNHPHWIQGIERYKGKLIIYSFGNFIFDQDWSRPTLEGMLIHFYWRGGALVGVRLVPTIDQDRCQPRPMSQAESVDSFARMWSGTDLLASGHYGPEPE